MASPHAAHHDDHHRIPARTMPQGTQELGADHGHESRDVLFAPVRKWFVGLAIFTIAVLAGMLMVYYQLVDGVKQAALKADPMLVTQQQHPEPRMLPNPLDNQNPLRPLVGPGEYYQEQRANEDSALAKLGLWQSDDQVARIPQGVEARALGAVNGPGSGAPSGFPEERMPSDGSGGIAEENRLQ